MRERQPAERVWVAWAFEQVTTCVRDKLNMLQSAPCTRSILTAGSQVPSSRVSSAKLGSDVAGLAQLCEMSCRGTGVTPCPAPRALLCGGSSSDQSVEAWGNGPSVG